MKKIALYLLVGGFLFSMVSCDKDKSVDEIVSDFTQAATVKVKTTGVDTTYKFSVAVATSRTVSSDTLCIVAASNIGTQKPTLGVIIRGKKTGIYQTGLDITALIGLNFANIMQNTVIVYMSDEEYILMTSGEINVTSITDKGIEGSFTGSGINGKEFEGFDSSDPIAYAELATLLLSPPYHIEGSFKAVKQDL